MSDRCHSSIRIIFLAICATIAVAGAAISQTVPNAEPNIKAVQFAGNSVISESILRQTIQSAVGQPYDVAQVRSDTAKIERLYMSRGYTLARVRDAELLQDGTLRFTIVEGMIDRVDVTGSHHTRSAVIKNLIELHPGSVYNEHIAAADRRRLDALRIYDEIVIEPSPSDTVGKVNLVVRIKERRTLFLTGAAGYGSFEGLIGYFDASEDDFLGNAQTLRFQWQRGIIVSNTPYDSYLEGKAAYALSFDDPSLLPHRLSFGVDLYHEETLFALVFNSLDLSPRQFLFREGATLHVGTLLSAHTQTFLSYRHDLVNFDNIPVGLLSSSDLANSAGAVGSLEFRGVLNHRDRDDNPRHGHLEDLRAEVGANALGGTFDYQKFTVDAHGYLPYGKGTLDLRAFGGIASNATPLSEQYWIGGYDILRGYDFDAFHGTRVIVTSTEYRWPVLQSIEFAIFTDSGYAWGAGSAVHLSDLRTGAGVGLRFRTPIGPIRLDFAYGNRAHTYLSLGQTY